MGATRRTPPRLLTIAGSDSGGGAGIQADLKTFAAHGAYGMSAITALTAQNTREVRGVHAAPPGFVADQIDAVFEDLGVDAVKIGMLADAGLVRAVAGRLRVHAHGIPIVLDPVMIAKSGDPLLRDDAVEALLEELIPLATLVTPNLPELARLTGLPVASEEERRRAGQTLGPAVLAKGALRVADEKLRLPPNVSRFVLTIGATMNQNGTALFEGVTVLFLAQFYGVDLSLAQQAMVVGICILGGIGTAGVPSGSIPVVAMILGLVGIPPEGIGLILGVDRFLDMCRTVLNVSGDLAAAVVVSRGEEGVPAPAVED